MAPPSSTPSMAVIFLLDRSYDQFRKTAVAAVEKGACALLERMPCQMTSLEAHTNPPEFCTLVSSS